jgi:hypothetical protein
MIPLRRILPVLCLLSGFAIPARAELQLLGRASSDSYQSLTFGLSAFCQAAGFPFALTEINDKASEVLMIPNLAGIDVQGFACLYWLASSSRPGEPATNLATVAILPTRDNATLTLQTLAALYPSQTTDEEQKIWRYSTTGPTPGPAASARSALPVLPQIFVSVRRACIVVSTSRDAVDWALKRPHPTPTVPAAAIAGQVRFDFEPAPLSAFLASGTALGFGIPAEDGFSVSMRRLLQETQALSLTIETSTAGIALRLSLTPRPDTPLAAHVLAMHPPADSVWRMIPDDSAAAGAHGGPAFWELPRFYEDGTADTANDLAGTMGDCLNGDHAAFIGRTSSTGMIYYAELHGLTNSAAAWARARANPQALLPFQTSFGLLTNGTRTVAGRPVLDLIFRGARSSAGALVKTNNPADMAAFMLRDGGMSVAVSSNRILAVTFGSTNAIGLVLNRVHQLAPGDAPLPARCRRLISSLPEAPAAAILLQPVVLVRQIAASLPGMQRDWIASLPEPGEGAALGAVRDPDGTLRVTLRIAANEISRGQKALTEGHSALRQMFMQMALQQMIQRKVEIEDPRESPSERDSTERER